MVAQPIIDENDVQVISAEQITNCENLDWLQTATMHGVQVAFDNKDITELRSYVKTMTDTVRDETKPQGLRDLMCWLRDYARAAGDHLNDLVYVEEAVSPFTGKLMEHPPIQVVINKPRYVNSSTTGQSIADNLSKSNSPREAVTDDAAPIAKVPDGTYTIKMIDGGWITIRLETQPDDAKFAAGQRLAGYLRGPNNTRDFENFAFVNGTNISVWKRFRGVTDKYTDAVKLILGQPTRLPEFRESYAIRSGRCAICGLPLTVPASLHRGVGPICAGRL